jgi:hypothetical protein
MASDGTTLFLRRGVLVEELCGLSQGMVTNQTERVVGFRHGRKRQRIGGPKARKEKSGHNQEQSVPGLVTKGVIQGHSGKIGRG